MPYRLAIALSLVLCDFVSLSHSAYLIYNTFTENASLFLNFYFLFFPDPPAASSADSRGFPASNPLTRFTLQTANPHIRASARTNGLPSSRAHLPVRAGLPLQERSRPDKKNACFLASFFCTFPSASFLFQVFQRGGSLRQQSRGILQQRF